jgi:hypothetical protein
MSAPVNFLDVALKCAARGWAVFPLAAKAKTPYLQLAPHWSVDSTTDTATITKWWTEAPACNIGIDLAKSGLVVLDFDAGDPPPNLGLPATFTIRTGRGQHLYFAGSHQQGKMVFGGKALGDIKSSGGYVVGPKCLHPSGSTYEPLNQSPVAPLPTDIIEKLIGGPSEQRTPVDASVNGAKIPLGQHDNELHRIAGKLRHIGLEQEAIYTTLVEICEKRCEGYGSDYLSMCAKHAKNICMKPVGQDTTVTIGGSAPGEAPADPENWLDYFRSVSQLEDGDVRMIVNGFLPEGVNMIGGLAGQGKTLFALSLVKSLTSGERFMDLYQPEEIIPVIYMVPESSSRAFKHRCRLFGITEDPELFLCRTVTEGRTLMLDDPMLLRAVEQLKPVIILDTLPRFNESGDENDAAGNKKLVDDVSTLRALGAVSVIGLHHSTKASADQEMTLENVLRGTGDIGAMADAVWAIRRDKTIYDNGNGPIELTVQCVKARDFEAPKPFKIAASYKKADDTIASYIDEDGDFHVIEVATVMQSQDDAFIKAINEEPTISREDLAEDLSTTVRKIRTQSRRLGYERGNGRYGKWELVKRKESIVPPPNAAISAANAAREIQ